MNIYIIAMAALGKGLSGSDRIFIELARNLQKRNHLVCIYLWEEGLKMCQTQNLEKSQIKFYVSNMDSWKRMGFFINYIARVIEGIKIALTVKLENSRETIVYSASEFWMDSLPALVLKLRFPSIIWVAAWFQTAPNLLSGFTEGKRQKTYKLSAFYYWLMQLPIKPIIKKFADVILINNEEEKKQFLGLQQDKTLVLLGAVNLKEITKWIQEHPLSKTKNYEAVFQGRFHPQKGVVELVKIWKLVTAKIPTAKLAMIGDGSLMGEVKAEIGKLNLNDNIKLYGYVFDGPKKYNIFSKSKIVVHPSFYDSGGMAAAEAMAFGLPGVAFDLPAYKTYYPQGMLKVGIGDLEDFADKIILLLTNRAIYNKLSTQGSALIKTKWSWEERTSQFLAKLDQIRHENKQ